MKKLLIIGGGRMGKDTVADLLCEKFGMTAKSSSEFACEKFIFEEVKDELGYNTPEECYLDRHKHRDLWFNMISGYNLKDPSKLAVELISTHDIYVGMRSSIELEGCLDKGLFDYIIYVDASDRISYREPNSSNNITSEAADIIIHNNGTLEELEAKVDTLYYEVLNYV